MGENDNNLSLNNSQNYMKPNNFEEMEFVFANEAVNYFCFETKEAFGVIWNVRINRSDKEEKASLTIECNTGSLSNVWELSCNMEVQYLEAEDPEIVKVKHTFKSTSKEVRVPDFLEKHPDRSKITVELKIYLEKIVGIPKNMKFNFENKYQLINDASIVAIDDRGIKKVMHVSKMTLSLYSPAFYKIFKELEEQNKPAEIELEESYEAIIVLLNLIYPSHCFPKHWDCDQELEKEEVEVILKLAEKYEIEYVKNQIEEFLIKTQELHKFWKMYFAETYQLDKLMSHELNEIQSVAEAAELKDSEDNFILSNATKAAIFERLLSIRKHCPYVESSDDSEGSYY